MKCIIIYYSQTGNTEKIAKAIHVGIEQAAGHCDIVRIKEANPRCLYEYDLIGLGCPLISMAEPDNVKAFIRNMRFVGGKHIFPFSTHGCRPEYFLPSIVPKLKRRGLIVIGWYDSYADVFMGGRANPNFPTAGHPDEIDLKEAEEFGKEMVERSRRIYAGEINLIPPSPKSPEPSLNKYLKSRHEKLKAMGVSFSEQMSYKYQPEKCQYPECRLCMYNCPMDGIDLTVKPPVIAKPCMGCGFCTSICPTGAIDRKIDENVRASAFNIKAFTDDWDEFHLVPLAEAEAEGRFRRHVPVEKISRGGPPGDPDKHPRWIIGKGSV